MNQPTDCEHRTYYTEQGERCRYCGLTRAYSWHRRDRQIDALKKRLALDKQRDTGRTSG